MTFASLQEIPLETIAGHRTRLADYAGQVLLIVNTASACAVPPAGGRAPRAEPAWSAA